MADRDTQIAPSCSQRNAERIRQLNDEFRRTFVGGVITITASVEAIAPPIRRDLLRLVREFDAFDSDNDPYGEHDFGAVNLHGETYFWKIDYYDRGLQYGSDNPGDAAKTTRVLTVMLASEY